MSAQSPPTYADVLSAVDSWPRERRRALMRHLFETLDDNLVDPDEKDRRRREALAGLRGMLKTDAPPPSDEDIRHWLDERRMKKYG